MTLSRLTLTETLGKADNTEVTDAGQLQESLLQQLSQVNILGNIDTIPQGFLSVFQEKNLIESFIEKERIDIKNYTLDYIGSVNNNYIKKIDENVTIEAKAYHKSFYNSYYDKLDIDFDLFLNKSNNYQKIDSFIVEKVFINDKIFNNLNNGVTSLFENYKKLSLYQEVENLVDQENYSSQLLGQITKNVVDNIKNDSQETKNISEFIFPQNNSIALDNKIVNIDTAKNILLFNLDEERFSFNISNSSNATNIMIQSFLNVSRSLYTLHPSSLNIYMSSESKIINENVIYLFSDKVVANEYLNLDFYKYINEKEGYFNAALFLKENNSIIGNGYNNILANQTNDSLLQNEVDNINPIIRFVPDGESELFKNIYTETLSSNRLVTFIELPAEESVLNQISNSTFGFANFSGQFFYPRSFIQYLSRQLFGEYKAKEGIYDLKNFARSDNKVLNRYNTYTTSDGLRRPLEGLINIVSNNAYEADFTNDTKYFYQFNRAKIFDNTEGILSKGTLSHFHQENFDVADSDPRPKANQNFLSHEDFFHVPFNEDHQKAYSSIKLAALINSRKSFRASSEDLDPIGSPVYVDNKPSIYYDFKDENFKISKSFAVDCKDSVTNILRNPIKTSLEVDNIVKKLKFKKVKTKKFESLIKKVKTNINKNIHLPYCESDSENISIIDEKNDIYKILFTKDDQDKVYSNIDLFLNRKINSKNYDSLIELKAKNLFENTNTDDLKDFINDYYVKSTFNSSSSLYLNLIKSITNEAYSFFNQDASRSTQQFSNIQNNLIVQGLYFNFIYNNKKDKAIDTISKRFIKNAILESNFSEPSIVSYEFKYDFKNFSPQDYDITNEFSMKQYIDDVLGSSQSLERIRKSVFSNNNVQKLAEIGSNYSVINDVDIENEKLSFIENRMIFPFIFVMKKYAIKQDEEGETATDKNVGNITKTTIFSTTKNVIKQKVVNNFTSVINPYTGRILRPEEEEFYYTMSGNVKSTESEKIILDVKFNNLSYTRVGTELLGGTSLGAAGKKHLFVDNFDLLCQSENYVFSNITNLIKDVLENFYNLSFFKSEAEIDNFIESKVDIVNIVKDIMYIYSELYLIYFSRLQRNIALNNFSAVNIDHTKNMASQLKTGRPSFGVTRSLNSNTYADDDIVYDFADGLSYIFQNAREEEGDYFDRDTQNETPTIRSMTLAEDIVGDFNKLVNQIDNNLESFYVNTKIDHNSISVEGEWKTEVTEVIYDIFTTLVTSDVYQAVSIDFIGLLINYLILIENKNYDEITQNELINELFPILGIENVNEIKQKLFNPIFANKLSKNIISLLEKNTSLYNDLDINANLSESAIQRYNSTKMFSYLGNKVNKSIDKIDYSFNNTFEENNIQHISNIENFYDADFHSFNLKINDLFNIEITSLINITVNLIDHENLNRVYLPKSYVFTPLLAFNKLNSEEKLLFYNPFSESLSDRLLKGNVADFLNIEDETNFFKRIIENKFPSLCRDNQLFSTDLFLHIISCHTASGQINLTNSYINGFSLDFEKINNSETTKEIIDLMTLNLDELTFFNTFNIKKEEAINMSIKNEDNYNLPSIFKSFEKGTTFFENAKALEDILGNNEMRNVSDNIYDTYSIHVNPKDFIFFELYEGQSTDTQNKMDDGITISEKDLLKIINFDINMFNGQNLYTGVDIQNDNYSIEISYKVI